MIVPQTAVAQGQNGIYVWVVGEDNKAEVRPIEPGDWYEDYWIINKGLEPGDLVITKGINRVENGTKVRIIKWAPKKPVEKTNGNHLGF